MLEKITKLFSSKSSRTESSRTDSATGNSAPDGFSILSDEFIRDPYPILAKLRAEAPVHHVESDDSWIVVTYKEVATVLRDSKTYSSRVRNAFDSVMAYNDPPNHTRARRALSPYFSQALMESLEVFVHEKAQALIEEGASRDEFDIVNEFAIPLVEGVIAKILGFSAGNLEEINKITAIGTYDFSYIEEFTDYIHRFVDSDSDKPEGSLTHHLLKDAIFTTDEIKSLVRLFWFAGTTTTSSLIGNAVNLLLLKPELCRQLTEEPGLIPAFVEELLRYDGSIRSALRVTRADTVLGGVSIPAGSHIRLSIPAANHDPAHYNNPEIFDLERNATDHLAFGAGAHFCLGSMIVRMEAKIALEELLEKYPAFTVARQEDQNSYIHSDNLRGLVNLRIKPITKVQS